jgi:uncharacterized GH25 family protein
MSWRLVFGGLAALVVAAPAAAHDYWLEPDSFFPAAGKAVAVRLHVGDHFAGEEERPFQKKPTLRFQLIGNGETVDLAARGRDGRTPVARVTFPAAGTYLLALDRGSHTIRLEADKFNKYLAEEGLGAVLEARRRAGEEQAAGRERYSRYIKALVQAGARQDDTWKRVLGQRLEVVPQANPYDRKAGAAMPVRVLFEGKPLAGAKVFAHRRAGKKTVTQTAVTSAEGLATFKLDGEGAWLVRLVHMRRSSGDKEADWESFWAALTFAVK